MNKKEDRKRRFFSLLLLLGIFLSFVGLVSAEVNVFIDNSIESGRWYSGAVSFFNLGGSWKEVILGVIVMAIIFAGMYDILQLMMFFRTPWVQYTIAAGIGIAVSIIGVVNKIAIFMLSITAALGAIGIFLALIVALIIFIGLTLGSNMIARWAAKRKGQVEEIKAIESADEAAAAITGLRKIQRSFRGRRRRGP